MTKTPPPYLKKIIINVNPGFVRAPEDFLQKYI